MSRISRTNGRVLGRQAMDDVDDGLAVGDLRRVDRRVEEVEGLAFGRQLSAPRASVRPRGSASRRLISTSRSNRARFCGELIRSSAYEFPIVVLPSSSYLTRSVDFASCWKYSSTFG